MIMNKHGHLARIENEEVGGNIHYILSATVHEGPRPVRWLLFVGTLPWFHSHSSDFCCFIAAPQLASWCWVYTVVFSHRTWTRYLLHEMRKHLPVDMEEVGRQHSLQKTNRKDQDFNKWSQKRKIKDLRLPEISGCNARLSLGACSAHLCTCYLQAPWR